MNRLFELLDAHADRVIALLAVLGMWFAFWNWRWSCFVAEGLVAFLCISQLAFNRKRWTPMASIRITVNCSWCHEANELDGRKVYCWSCGHRADVPRVECDCRKCRNERAGLDVRKQAAA